MPGMAGVLLSRRGLLAGGGGLPASWVTSGALLDADYSGGRYWYNNSLYGDEASLNTAVGGSQSGVTRTIGPFLSGSDLIQNGLFETNTDGWTSLGGILAVSSGALQHTNDTGATAVLIATSPVLVTPGAVYRVGVQAGNGFTRRVSFFSAADAQLAAIANDVAGNATYSQAAAAPSSSTKLALRGNTVGNTQFALWDNVSLKESVPLSGWVHNGDTIVVSGTTPASIATDEVVWQCDGDNERNRLRLVRLASNKNLNLVLATDGTTRFTLVIGLVNDSAAFSVSVSFTNGAWAASLNGGAPVSIATAQYPPGDVLRIGRSFTGETWGGTISRLTVLPSTSTNDRLASYSNSGLALAGLGDSFIAGSGGVVLPTLLATATSRQVVNLGLGGDTAQNELARYEAAPGYYGHTLIVWDGRHNGWVDLTTYMAAINSMVAHQTTARFIVLPPVGCSGDTTAYLDETIAIRDAMLAAYGDKMIDWRDHLTTTTSSGRVIVDTTEQLDGVHLTSTAMAKIITVISNKLTAKGW